MKPICVSCHRFFRMTKSGFYFIEGMPTPGSRPQPGLDEPHRWTPYKLWSGDRWTCEGCGDIIIVGTGHKPISEHYKPEFAERVEQLGATFQVNDC